MIISSETHVATSFLTRRYSKDQQNCHTNNIVLQLLIKLKKQLTFSHLSVYLNSRLLGSSQGRISAKEFSFHFKVVFSRLIEFTHSSMKINNQKVVYCIFPIKWLYLFIKVVNVEQHTNPTFHIGWDVNTFSVCYFCHSICNHRLK